MIAAPPGWSTLWAKIYILAYSVVLGLSLLFGEPSRAELFDKASRAELFSEKASRAELFAFKTEPNRAFGFPKLSYSWLFLVDFFNEYKFLVEKMHFYWCLQDYTLNKTEFYSVQPCPEFW